MALVKLSVSHRGYNDKVTATVSIVYNSFKLLPVVKNPIQDRTVMEDRMTISTAAF